jgi:aspartyl-tRNA(Asn)/glutamyl-tRNA(Gln) amidotransferase subunit A
MELTGRTIHQLSADLARGAVTSRALTESALTAIAANPGPFTRVNADGARAAADASDQLRGHGVVPSPLAGIPISVKDLFDVAGEPTSAGSSLLTDAPPAMQDAPVIARLRAAGAVIMGRTHMSEFAFSGLGANPHCPVAANPRDRTRVPGGSSSGAAASVGFGQSAMGLGSDTGGSVRIPASFCGLAGFKPTQRRITRAGVFPLSESLDSIGPIANSIDCCRIVDRILSDHPADLHPPLAMAGLRFAVVTDLVLNDLDEVVARAFDRALDALSGGGAVITRITFPELLRIPAMFANGTLTSAECFTLHSNMGLLAQRDRYDPNVLARVEAGATMSAKQYLDLLHWRSAVIADANARTAGYDAMLLPSTATVAPRFDDIATTAGWNRANGLALRNASVINFLDRCAANVPMSQGDELPTGLTVVGESMEDARLLAIAEAVEGVVACQP